MLATSLTIGSGGSAGVFGPSMVIGGLLGAFVGSIFHSFGLFTWIDVSSISIVGMVAFFSATAKTPLSTIIMGSEMTGGYALLAPMMLATFIAYAVSGQNNSIFKSQVAARSDSLLIIITIRRKNSCCYNNNKSIIITSSDQWNY
jgi:chloride channel protein, CIC family